MRNDGEKATGVPGDSPEAAAFHVIILGAGGGPREDNATALLVRSVDKQWSKGSVLAVDAGVHLSAIIRTLEQTSTVQPEPRLQVRSSLERDDSDQGDYPLPMVLRKDSPFYGAPLPYDTARANGTHIIRELISTYLITHAHLDHVSGFIVNTPAFQHTSRPKKLAALPGTITAIKLHLFNNLIWPNLSDEEGGVGLVSYMRLVEGGSLAIGVGEGRGYVEVCEGLTVKSWSISHGHKMTTNSHRNSNAGAEDTFDFQYASARRASLGGFDANSLRSRQPFEETSSVYDSSAFFIRDESTEKEILVFGDVEPDSLSLSPRTAQVWSDAAPKIVRGLLKAVFIECSYDNSQPDEVLFGHLAPRHLIEELKVLATKVAAFRDGDDKYQPGQKRKRTANGSAIAWDLDSLGRKPKSSSRAASRSARQSSSPQQKPDAGPSPLQTTDGMELSPLPLSKLNGDHMIPPTMTTASSNASSIANEHTSHPHPHFARNFTSTPIPARPAYTGQPLNGIKIVIIHVKDTLRDGKPVGNIILDEMREYEQEAQLGCEFVLSQAGGQLWL